MREISLPEGWYQTKLAEIAEWGSGGTPSRKEASYYEGNIPWVKTGDLGPKVLDSASEHISELAVQNSSAKYFPKGSVAIAMYGATIGKTSILGIDATTNQACGVGNPIDGLTFSEFLYYFLLNEKDNFIAKGKGGAQPNISQALIKEHEIALPPLAEQKVIADKLDTLLAQVETSKARLERIPQILKTFRQSVLAAAVSGKLTEEWREENEVSIESWVSTNIGELAQVATGKTPKRTNVEYWDGGDIPWLTSAATGAALTFEAEQFVTRLAVKECTLKLFPIGTLLLAMYGEGKTRGQVTELQLEATCNQACAAILVDETKVSKEFLKLRLQENYEETRKAAVGGAQPNLNLNKVREITVELPSEPEQAEIVRRVEELFAFADSIEKKTNAALERVNNLTQAILAKAFRGELTADWRAANPDLITGENSSEILLDKIKAERERANAVNKDRQKSTRKTKSEKKILPEIYRENLIVDVIDKKGIAKPQEIFDELKEIMDLRRVLKEISLLLEQKIIKELDKDGQQYLEIRR
ncbi:restriction endonuclease subunit S [Vibrio cholerae]|nr:restriction endonuclease subunit S [Vibrio cholerae]